MKRGLGTIEVLMIIAFLGAIALFFYSNYYGKTKSSGGDILIVDMHQVHRDLGRHITDMQQQQQDKSRMEVNLKILQAEVSAAIAARKQEFGENPTEEQKVLLAAVERDAVEKINAEITKYQQFLVKLERERRQKFRAEVKAVVDVIQAEKGASIVLIASPEVLLSCNHANFITDEVVDAMQRSSE
jgi:Skp family chaperone for outer membrane proteins